MTLAYFVGVICRVRAELNMAKTRENPSFGEYAKEFVNAIEVDLKCATCTCKSLTIFLLSVFKHQRRCSAKFHDLVHEIIIVPLNDA